MPDLVTANGRNLTNQKSTFTKNQFGKGMKFKPTRMELISGTCSNPNTGNGEPRRPKPNRQLEPPWNKPKPQNSQKKMPKQ